MRYTKYSDRTRAGPGAGFVCELPMIIAVTIVHVIVCLFLIIVVLLQSGKAADLAGAFGGMGSQTAFGPRGSATVLSKATTIAAALFMLTSLSLSILHTRLGGSSVGSTVLEKTSTSGAPAPAKAPAQPAPTPAPVNTPVPAGQPVQVPQDTNKSAPASVTIETGGQKQTVPVTPAAPEKKK